MIPCTPASGWEKGQIENQVATGGGFYVIGRRSASPVLLMLSGICMGLGIAAMHYTGMTAMRVADYTHSQGVEHYIANPRQLGQIGEYEGL